MYYIAAFSPKFTQIHHKYTKVAVSHRKSPKLHIFTKSSDSIRGSCQSSSFALMDGIR